MNDECPPHSWSRSDSYCSRCGKTMGEVVNELATRGQSEIKRLKNMFGEGAIAENERLLGLVDKLRGALQKIINAEELYRRDHDQYVYGRPSSDSSWRALKQSSEEARDLIAKIAEEKA